jgi:RNA polymerase sigma-B factor
MATATHKLGSSESDRDYRPPVIDERRRRCGPQPRSTPAFREPVDMRHPLQRAEMSRLWELRADGDTAAREELARRFAPMARKVALRYVASREPFDDLLQVANLGLISAIDRFDAGRGNSFVSFAVPTMLGELKRYFRNTGWAVHVPRGTQELALEVRTASRQMTARFGRPPRVAELSQYMEREIAEIVEGLQVSRAQFADSLDAPVTEDDGDLVLMGETLGAEDDHYGLVDATAALADGIRKLPFGERRALALRFRENLTQTEIARRLGCSQMQISRLIRRGTDRLRESLEQSR